MKLLKDFCFVFTITFAVLVAVNILAFVFLKFNSESVSILAKHGMGKISKAYPAYDINTVMDILRETWENKLIYSPYVQFREPARSGSHVSISKKGFRLNGSAENIWGPERADNLTNIFLFGGSTTFGYGVRNNETIAAHIESLLNETINVRVYNFGRGFYFSNQERILFENLLSDAYIPDIAIFIDGLNEFYHPNGEPAFTGLLAVSIDNSFYAAQKKFFRELPVVNWARFYRDKIANYFPKVEDGNQPTTIADRETTQIILQRYLVNTRIIKSISKEFGVDSYFVWQPVPEYHMDLASHPFYFSEDLQAEANRALGYRQAKTIFEKINPNIIWAAEIASETEGNFVDKVHYSSAFNREIAKAIIMNLKIPHEKTANTSMTP